MMENIKLNRKRCDKLMTYAKHLKVLSILLLVLMAGPWASAQIANLDTTAAAAPPEKTEMKRNARGEPLCDLPFVKPVPLAIIFSEISLQTGVPIETKGKMPEKAIVAGDGLTVEQALEKIAGPNKLFVKKNPSGIGFTLMDEAAKKEDEIQNTRQKIFIPKHISAQEFSDAVTKANMLTKDIGSIAIDKRTNQVIVMDKPEVLARIQDFLDLIDKELFQRVFEIKYADINAIVEKIQEYKSEPGRIDVDEKNHLIFVEDVLNNIQRMESLIELLDRRQKRKVYRLNSIGIESEDVEGLVDQIEALITPEAYYHIDPKRGLFVLEDTPQVHEDVQKFLQVFNQTSDQVQIQAEFLDVKQDYALEYGMKVSAASKDFNDIPVAPPAEGATPAPVSTLNNLLTATYSKESFIAEYTQDRIRAQLNALLTDTNTRLLLRPHLTIKNGEEAEIHSGNNIAIPNYSSGYGYDGYNNNNNNNNNNNTNGSLSNAYQGRTSYNYMQTGLVLNLIPWISPTGLIELEVDFENSAAGARVLDAPDTSEASIRTVLIIPDGKTRVISGLLSQEDSDSKGGIPVLVKIPWIGPLLFGGKSTSNNVRNLMIFLTPTIVRESAPGSLVAFEFDSMDTETADWGSPPALLKEQKDTGDNIPEIPDFEALFSSTTSTLSADAVLTTGTLRRLVAPDLEEYARSLEPEQPRINEEPEEKKVEETPAKLQAPIPPSVSTSKESDISTATLVTPTPKPFVDLNPVANKLLPSGSENSEEALRKAMGGTLPDLNANNNILGPGVTEGPAKPAITRTPLRPTIPVRVTPRVLTPRPRITPRVVTPMPPANDALPQNTTLTPRPVLRLPIPAPEAAPEGDDPAAEPQ